MRDFEPKKIILLSGASRGNAADASTSSATVPVSFRPRDILSLRRAESMSVKIARNAKMNPEALRATAGYASDLGTNEQSIERISPHAG
jgi:hypothetical protein